MFGWMSQRGDRGSRATARAVTSCRLNGVPGRRGSNAIQRKLVPMRRAPIPALSTSISVAGRACLVIAAVAAAVIATTAPAIAGPARAAPTTTADEALNINVYVAPDGNDRQDGRSSDKAVRTLPRAQQLVRAILRGHRHPVSVIMAGGTYHLSAPLTFGAADSGTPATPVSWQAKAGERVTISGGRELNPVWKGDLHRPGVYIANVGKGLKTDGLFINGQRQILARYPNFDPTLQDKVAKASAGAQRNAAKTAAAMGGNTSLAAINARAKSWTHPELADVRALHCNTWGGASFTVTGRDASGNLALHWVGDNNRSADCPNPALPINTSNVMVENVLDELDAPNEWYYDAKAGRLYYEPPAGFDLTHATVQTAEQDELIHIAGASSRKPVRALTFSGLTFTATHRTLFDHPYETLQLGDWAVARTGALYLKNTEDITVTGSSFDQLGGNAVFMDGYNNGNVISASTFTDNGATDVQTVGSRSAVRDRSTWAQQVKNLDDATPGPKTEDYPRDITISGNVMTDNGRFELQTSNVNISMSQNVKVVGNTLRGSPRSCLNINDGTWGGDLIRNNDIYDCVTQTGDHGPINAWGRDRYWPLCGPSRCADPASDALDHRYARLDVVKPNVIDHNRIWHDSEWTIDLDDGSTNYKLTNNLLLNGGIKLRDGFSRTVENNIMVNGHLYEQVSHANDGDKIEHNITLSNLAYDNVQTDPAVAKYAADDNVFYNNGQPVGGLDGDWAVAGLDKNSVVADPQFVKGSPWDNPAQTDYTVAANSPAITLGFKNFRMDNFGVAGTSGPPPVSFAADTGGSGATIQAQPEPLMGATVTSIYSTAVQSSVGLGDQNGVFLQTVPATSFAGSHGLRTGEVIRTINGTTVTDRNSFWHVYNGLAAGTSMTLGIWRAQASTTVTIAKPSDAELLNNTAGITYTGSGWGWRGSAAGGAGSFQDDVDATTAIGDSYSIAFNGTGIDLITETNSDEGKVDIQIDGVLNKTIDCASASRAYQQQVSTVSGLSAGPHTLKAVMKSGNYLIADAFRVHP